MTRAKRTKARKARTRGAATRGGATRGAPTQARSRRSGMTHRTWTLAVARAKFSVRAGNLDALKNMLTKGCLRDQVTGGDQKLLAVAELIGIAAELDNVDMLTLLLPHTDSKGIRHGMTHACKRGHMRSTKLLLDNGGKELMLEPESTFAELNPPGVACFHGHLALAKYFMAEKCITMMSIKAAVLGGHLDIVKALYDHVPDTYSMQFLQASDISLKKASLMDLAAWAWRPDILSYLQERGKANQRCLGFMLCEAVTAFVPESFPTPGENVRLSKADQLKTINVLVSLKAGVGRQRRTSALHEAIMARNVEAIASLLKYKASPSANSLSVTCVHTASYVGDVEIMKLLFAHGGNAHVTTSSGVTPLHYAGSAGVVKFLIDNGAILEMQEQNGSSPLLACVARKNMEAVKALLEFKADTNSCDANKTHPIHVAAVNKSEEMAKVLLSHKANVDAKTFSDSTALHEAAEIGCTSVVGVLLEAKAELTPRDSRGWTPLHSAAYPGHTAVVKQLLNHKVDPAITENIGWTPLHCAAGRNRIATVRVLLDALKNYREYVPVDSGAGSNAESNDNATESSVPRVKTEPGSEPTSDVNERPSATGVGDAAASVDGGAPPTTASASKSTDKDAKATKHTDDAPPKVPRHSINYASKAQLTALHHSARRGHIEVVKLLVEAGATTRTTDEEGTTPLLCCAIDGQVEVVKYLLEHSDAEKSMLEKQMAGWSALHHVADKGDDKMVTFLAQNTAIDIDAKDGDGWTPIHSAAHEGHTAAVEALIAAGASVNEVEKQKGWSPLHFAAGKGHCKMVEALINAKADAGLAGTDRTTPLHRAVFRHHGRVVTRLLAEPSVDVLSGDKDGATVLHLTAASANVRSFQLRKTSTKTILDNLFLRGGLDMIDRGLSQQTNAGRAPLQTSFVTDNLDLHCTTQILSDATVSTNLSLLWFRKFNESRRAVHPALFNKICSMAKCPPPCVEQHGSDVDSPLTTLLKPNSDGGFGRSATALQVFSRLLWTRPRLLKPSKRDVIRVISKRTPKMKLLFRHAVTAAHCCPETSYESKCCCLHCACSTPSTEGEHMYCVNFLLNCKADPNVPCEKRQDSTPLCDAAGLGNTKVVERLLRVKADASLKAHDGRVPHEYAFDNGHTELSALLLDAFHGVGSQECTGQAADSPPSSPSTRNETMEQGAISPDRPASASASLQGTTTTTNTLEPVPCIAQLSSYLTRRPKRYCPY